jgi:hypothetical protein
MLSVLKTSEAAGRIALGQRLMYDRPLVADRPFEVDALLGYPPHPA